MILRCLLLALFPKVTQACPARGRPSLADLVQAFVFAKSLKRRDLSVFGTFDIYAVDRKLE